MDIDKRDELLMDVRQAIGDEGVCVLGCTVYDRDGNYVATLRNDAEGNPVVD